MMNMLKPEKEDVSMIEGELPAQPTQPSLPNQHALDNNNHNAEEHKNNGKSQKNKGNDKKDGPVETPEELADRFEYISKLGEGTYGVVHMAKELMTDTIVAVKEIKIDHCDDGIPSTAIREIAVL